MPPRVDDFKGSLEEYVAFLEHEVRGLREKEAEPRPHSRSESRRTGFVQEPAQTRDTNSEHHEQRDDSSCMTIVQYEPSITVSPQKRSRSSASATQPATRWSKAIAEADLLAALTSGDVVEYLLDWRRSPPSLGFAANPERPTQDAAVRLQSYGQCFSERRKTVSLATKLLNFQEFLFLSACAVLLKTGTAPSKDVLDISRASVGSKSSDRYCKRILDAAVYLNKLIDMLSAQHWDSRATELVLLWNIKTRFFFRLACSSEESLPHLKASLLGQDFQLSVHDEPWRHKGPPLFVPSLIGQIIGDTVHVARIAEALEYKHAAVLAFNPLRAV